MDGVVQTGAVPATGAVAEPPVVVARDATYGRPGYRSFRFASATVGAGACTAILSSEHAAARDFLLACAGLVRPTAGSLVVAGIELAAGAGAAEASLTERARAAWRQMRRARWPRGTVGVGAVSGLAVPASSLTVAEAVRHECGSVSSGELLGYLGRFRLATSTDQQVGSVSPMERAYLSAALACSGEPRLAVVDLADGFCDGMSGAQAARVVRDLSAWAHESGMAVLVAVADPAAARAADAVCALDIEAEEAMGR